MSEPPAASSGPPTPPWERKRLQRRRALTREAIVDAALEIIKAEGTEAVTMRRVAAELGVVASSLYARVGNRDELLRLAVYRVFDTVGRVEDTGDWKSDLATYFTELHRRLRPHADLVRYAFAEAPPAGEGDLVETEQLLGRLIAAGIPPKLAAWTFDRLLLYTVADVYQTWCFERATGDREMESWLQEMRTYLLNLPADQYPMIAAHTDLILDSRMDERFVCGLNLMLDGIATQIAR